MKVHHLNLNNRLRKIQKDVLYVSIEIKKIFDYITEKLSNDIKTIGQLFFFLLYIT